MAQYLKVEKEKIKIRVTTVSQILVGWFIKDKGIRFTDYFNRDKEKSSFIVLSEVEVYDMNTRELIENNAFLAVNIHYIVTATEVATAPEVVPAAD